MISVSLVHSIKIHLYWSMRNCGDSPDVLRQLIMNIPHHYKVCNVYTDMHTCCNRVTITTVTPHHLRPCHDPSYKPSKQLLTSQLRAEDELVSHLKSTYVYRYAQEFSRASIESSVIYIHVCIYTSVGTLTGWSHLTTSFLHTCPNAFTSAHLHFK